MIKFVFNERKAAQAAAHLLKMQGGCMPYMQLLKLLYLADRESLLESDRPITGDDAYSMPRGPVLSAVYDLLRRTPEQSPSPWFDYVSKADDYMVRSVSDSPDRDELSPYELALLEKTFHEFKDIDRFDLSDLTHAICPEWEDPEGSSVRIPPERILEAGGKTQAQIEQISREVKELCFIASL